MNQETRVGLFLIMAACAIAAGSVFLGNFRLFHRTARYYSDFSDVEALPPKAAVKVSGVEIGKVTKVQLVEGHARVTMDIDPNLPIYEDATATIGSTGIIGTKFVDLKPGTPTSHRLESGAAIRSASGKGLNQMMEKFSALFETDDKYGNAVDNLKATIWNVRHVSEALNTAMGNHASDMEEIVMNVRDLSESAKVFAQHLEEISTEKKEDVKVAISKIRSISEKLDALLTRVTAGKGALGAIVADDKTGQDVKEAISSIKETANSAKKVMGRFTQIHTYWDYRYRYDFREHEGKSDVALRFVPRAGKFYGIGVTNIGTPVQNEKHVVTERKNQITAVLGQDYGPFTGFAGAIKSAGGVGLEFRPFFEAPSLDHRFSVSSEISDFGRDDLVLGRRLTKPVWSAGAHFAVTRWLWLGARAEDLLERTAFMAYTNITFRDEDLAYFFGFASLAK